MASSSHSTKRYRPGVVLAVLMAVIALLFGLMALTKSWMPRLGLDLKGGMTITLTATNPQVPPTSLELAANIIQQRVDSLGVGEASVTTAGQRLVIISAPNVERDDLVDLVGSTAQLAFRPVINIAAGDGLAPEGGDPSTDPDADPGSSENEPGLPTAPPSPTPSAESDDTLLDINDVMAYQPTDQELAAFQQWSCSDDAPDTLQSGTFACDAAGLQKFLLGPVALTGQMVDAADSGIPQGQLAIVVTLDFNDEGTGRLADFSSALLSRPEPGNQFAVVLDGVVQSNASVNERIPGGQAQISGNFTEQSAQQLANVLKFGALPLDFEPSQVETVSPTLGGEQLRVAIIAGAVGLLVVIGYAFLYYRALGAVIVGSLSVAGALTYSLVSLLGASLGFTLNLPGIAGAIVSIGMTADAFIIYFERIRDEAREGRSIRSALSTGWRKARSTILVADFVSILSAIVLFFLASGSVQGFAFMLGLTTLINLAVVFFFTVPLMHLLGRTKFFGEGRKFSGLSTQHLGVEGGTRIQRRRSSRLATAKEA